MAGTEVLALREIEKPAIADDEVLVARATPRGSTRASGA